MPESSQGGESDSLVPDSFMKLQRIRQSFDEAGALSRVRMRALKRLARELGGSCARLCVRELARPGDHVERSRWASTLLLSLGRSEHKSAVLAALHKLARDESHSSPARLRALGLLADLDQPIPVGLALHRSPEDIQRSLGDMSALIATPAGIAQAGDTLARRLPAHEMLALLDAMSVRAPTEALPLIAELLLRNDLEEPARRELRRLRAELISQHPDWGIPRMLPLETAVASSTAVATATVGRHASGKRALIAWRVDGRSRPRRYRVLLLHIDADGMLIEGDYRDAMPVGGAEREMLVPLRRCGYQLDTVGRADAAQICLRAAQSTHQLGRLLPRAFYLGRDMLGIYDQHVAFLVRGDDLPTVLDRAYTLAQAGQNERARPLFELVVKQAPERPAGHIGLAMCLLTLGDEGGAVQHLRRASHLQPENPNAHWNLGAIAHRQNRRGSCYLALVDYLECVGDDDGAPGDSQARRALAERFIGEYERIAGVEFPDAEPGHVAEAEELVIQSWRCVREGQQERALDALRHVLTSVPEHYPALTCLGVAQTQLGHLTEARAVLTRALALRPGYPIARDWLQQVEHKLAVEPKRTQKRLPPGPDGGGVEEVQTS